MSEPLRQKIKTEANVSFQNKGNKLQYEFKLEQLAKMEEENSYLRSIKVLRRLIKKIDKVSKMQKHNKLIGLADRSANGWMTAQECMPDELVTD